jgi:hypothetical protein
VAKLDIKLHDCSAHSLPACLVAHNVKLHGLEASIVLLHDRFEEADLDSQREASVPEEDEASRK